MKKLLFSFVAICMGMCAMAQSSVYVYQKDGKTLEIPVSNLDSISFTKPVGPLSGVFSVAADKTVKFAPGNLQYTQSTNTWEFATNQYDMLGMANVSTDIDLNDALADKIDLFGWSGNYATAPWGISISTSNDDYSGDFVDWGKNIGDGKTWRTLTSDEWSYLLNDRTDAKNLKGVACINGYVNGLILLPDDCILPSGVTFKSGFSENYSGTAYADYQKITLADWQKLEAAGAIFLPAAGQRYTFVDYLQKEGYYWSATLSDENSSVALSIDSSAANIKNTERLNGQAVRLVQDVE